MPNGMYAGISSYYVIYVTPDLTSQPSVSYFKFSISPITLSIVFDVAMPELVTGVPEIFSN